MALSQSDRPRIPRVHHSVRSFQPPVPPLCGLRRGRRQGPRSERQVQLQGADGFKARRSVVCGQMLVLTTLAAAHTRLVCVCICNFFLGGGSKTFAHRCSLSVTVVIGPLAPLLAICALLPHPPPTHGSRYTLTLHATHVPTRGGDRGAPTHSSDVLWGHSLREDGRDCHGHAGEDA